MEEENMFARFSALILILIALMSGSLAQAQTDALRSEASTLTRQISQRAAELASSSPDLAALRSDLISMRESVITLEGELQTLLAEREDQLSRLGVEVEGESSSVSRQRDSLTTEVEQLNEALSRTAHNLSEISRLEGEIADLRRQRFYSDISVRSDMVAMPSTWVAAWNELGAGYASLDDDDRLIVQVEAAESFSAITALKLVGALLVAVGMAVPIRLWLLRNVVAPIGRAGHDSSLGVVVGFAQTGIRALPSLLAMFALYHAVQLLELNSPLFHIPNASLWITPCAFLITEAAVTVFLSTSTPVLPFQMTHQGRSAVLRVLILSIAGLLALDHFYSAEVNLLAGLETLKVVESGLVAILLSVLTISICYVWRRHSAPSDAENHTIVDFYVPRPIRGIVVLVGALSILGALFGYAVLAKFMATRVALIGGALLFGLIVREAIKQLARFLTNRLLRARMPAADGSDLMDFWVGFLVDAFMLVAIIPVLLLLSGLELELVERIMVAAATGFSIGSVKISFIQIGIAVLSFFVLIAITRLLQRTAERRVLSRLRVDQGIQASLKTLIGYVGLVIAFMTGVSLLGFDLSNLAIIAGALSVGIGFGLQSIVNNFVSGLILLFERPIKVGDWVVTSSGEGIVKKISVRSTEIETFDRSSILVPNSELIANSVTNWTHKNRLGRVSVPVGVAYKEDPQRILELLSRIPSMLDEVLEVPEPQILFTGFGDSSLDFELRVYIADISRSLITRTQIRVAIFKLFRDEDVEIPFPQRDLHIRDADTELVDMFRKPDADGRV
ncbi:MAG: hypothetical protein CBB65_09315 [Hyphomonadaceae bacterium TMED5]|nr:hypothetical protein [Ponticaulis sp.]OUX99139.1 MAG: hypothetical protein CBB65_09315 [Hyphomonadaceae bacterium TMED5]